MMLSRPLAGAIRRLVVSYVRGVIGPQFAFQEAAGSQFVYPVLFSYAFFLEGFTGLSVTIRAIVTLFVVMHMTARVQWGHEVRAYAASSFAALVKTNERGNTISPDNAMIDSHGEVY